MQGTGLEGKIATVGSESGQNDKTFYGFDYTYENGAYKGWYYLGAFQNNVSSLYMIAGEGDSDLVQKQNALAVNGLWFVLEGEE